jgi:hypothetical protein
MGHYGKKTWGKNTLKYDPKRKMVWSISRSGNIARHKDMPSYGLPRKEAPNG